MSIASVVERLFANPSGGVLRRKRRRIERRMYFAAFRFFGRRFPVADAGTAAAVMDELVRRFHVGVRWCVRRERRIHTRSTDLVLETFVLLSHARPPFAPDDLSTKCKRDASCWFRQGFSSRRRADSGRVSPGQNALLRSRGWPNVAPNPGAMAYRGLVRYWSSSFWYSASCTRSAAPTVIVRSSRRARRRSGESASAAACRATRANR